MEGHASSWPEFGGRDKARPSNSFPNDVVQARKRVDDRGCLFYIVGKRTVAHGSQAVRSMLVIMTVNAEQFPIAAVERIVVVIKILVVDGEFLEALAFELTRTPAADMGEKLKGPHPVPGLTLRHIPPQLCLNLHPPSCINFSCHKSHDNNAHSINSSPTTERRRIEREDENITRLFKMASTHFK